MGLSYKAPNIPPSSSFMLPFGTDSNLWRFSWVPSYLLLLAFLKKNIYMDLFFYLTDLWLLVCKLIWVLILVAVWTLQASECEVPLCQKRMAFGKGSTERSTFFSRFGPLSSCNQHFDIESKIIMRFVNMHHMKFNTMRSQPHFIHAQIWQFFLNFL